MWGRAGRGGRHAAPTGRTRRAAAAAARNADAGEAGTPPARDGDSADAGTRSARDEGSADAPTRNAGPAGVGNPSAREAAPAGARIPSAPNAGIAPNPAAADGAGIAPDPDAGIASVEAELVARIRPRAAEHAEPVAIIGGSAITLLAGRIRRLHTIADLESPTTELSPTAPVPRVRSGLGSAVRRRVARPRSGRPAAPSPAPGTVAALGSAAEPELAAGGTGLRALVAGRGRRLPLIAAAVTVLAVATAAAGTLINTDADPVAAPPPPPTVLEQPGAPVADVPATSAPTAARVDAYLGALRSADIPASRSGRPETEAAAAICEQSHRGVPDAELARSLPAMLTGIDRRQAPLVVDLAKRYYCP